MATGKNHSVVIMGQNVAMRFPGEYPFRGQMVWLTADQGGRSSGPPETPAGHDYATTAFVPPHSAEGLASWGMRVEDRSAWRSPASAGWLIVENTGAYTVEAGSVVVVTEGPCRVVGYFHVDEVTDSSATQL
ncbi:hypothetical protein [Nocardia sp. NPDC127526]|uniref:hypothetical protein n=1 Tax=Nocardia sp. NPDC127526 TaxID=3345393 RepID=UPI0036410329